MKDFCKITKLPDFFTKENFPKLELLHLEGNLFDHQEELEKELEKKFEFVRVKELPPWDPPPFYGT